MNWINLTDEEQLQDLISQSNSSPQVIFKHSTRCSISSVVLTRLKGTKEKTDFNIYYLDLIAYRSLSNKIAELFNEHHESPQVLVIKNGQCTYVESHMGITVRDLTEQVGVN